jgi:ABC-2 type transport system permease protein
MKLRNLNIVIAREYLTRVKKKSFLLITFLGPIFFAAVAILPTFIMMMTEDKGKKVAVVDESGIVMPTLTDSETMVFTDFSEQPLDSVKADFIKDGFDLLLAVSEIDSTKTVAVSAFSEKPLSVDIKEALASKVNDAVEDYRIGAYGVEGLKEMMNDVKSDISVSTYTVSEDGEENITSSEVYMGISLVLSMIIYMFIAMFSGMVMQSVIEEKASRVVEVLVSSVKATELMFGKIIGVACVALTQFFLWVVLTAVLVVGASAFMGFDKIDPEKAQEMVQMQMGGMDVEQIAPTAQTGGMDVVLSTLAQLDFGQLILGFVIYFVLGYLLYASFFAAIGSAVENEADTNQLQVPVTIPLLIAFFIAFYAFKAPDSPVVFWGSMIPFTSPIVMLARIPFGVPAWELVLSIAVLAATFVVCGWASAKIYKIGILMFGKKTTFKDLWKWLRQN